MISEKLFLMVPASVGACLAFALAAQAQTAPALAPLSGGQIMPLRPPAVPLIVRSPYVSTWQRADALAGTRPAFWAGRPKPITGIARVDGQSYVFLGDPQEGGRPLAPPMTQTALSIMPTQSIYRLQGGGITVSLDFLSPVEPKDLQRLSIPFGYIFATARSADGRPHTVSLYFDITGEWAHGDDNAPIRWERRSILAGTQALTVFAVTPADPKVLGEVHDYPM